MIPTKDLYDADRKILNYYLPRLQSRQRQIDTTYVPPCVLRYADGEPYAIGFDTLDGDHYHYDIQKGKLTSVRELQRI